MHLIFTFLAFVECFITWFLGLELYNATLHWIPMLRILSNGENTCALDFLWYIKITNFCNVEFTTWSSLFNTLPMHGDVIYQVQVNSVKHSIAIYMTIAWLIKTKYKSIWLQQQLYIWVHLKTSWKIIKSSH